MRATRLHWEKSGPMQLALKAKLKIESVLQNFSFLYVYIGGTEKLEN
jgi:hypothetical protein